MRKLRETMIKLRTGVDLKTCVVSLPWLQLKAWHAQGALDTEQLLVRRTFDIEPPAPHTSRLRSERRDKCCEKLVAYSGPFRAGDRFLIERPGNALTHAKKTATATEPTDVDSLRSSVDAPNQARERRIILGMNRCRGPKRHKIGVALIWLVTAILEINVHLDYVIVFVFRRFLKVKLLANRELLSRGALKLHSRI